MRTDPTCWAGVDVGGSRKGFHLAILDAQRRVVVAGERIATARGVVQRLRPLAPVLVGVDSPRRPAEPGQRSRACEREFIGAGICALRFTPDLRELRSNPFHEWVLMGLALYRALDRAGLSAVECFPTAAWTVWGGPRGRTPRTAWSARILDRLKLSGAPRRLGQDGRDAIGAALTAQLHWIGETQRFGEIAIPRPEGIRLRPERRSEPAARDRAVRLQRAATIAARTTAVPPRLITPASAAGSASAPAPATRDARRSRRRSSSS